MIVEILDPRLVIATGIVGAGKSGTMRELCRMVPNAVLLSKDVVNQGMSHLPVEHDGNGLVHDGSPISETPFGEMYTFSPITAYYRNHVRLQTHMVNAVIARDNLDLGKVVIVDSFAINLLQNGNVERFINQPNFCSFPRYLIHFIVDEEEGYERLVQRAKTSPYWEARDRDKIASREAFHEYATVREPMRPVELERITHQLIDTSGKSPLQCAGEVLSYIKVKL